MDQTHFHIEGLPPFDGDYPIDLNHFTNKELHTIKQLSGVRAGELEEALDAGDNDLILAFAVIALERSGRSMPKQAVDVLWNADFGKFTLVIPDDEDADASPPSQTPSANDENDSDNEKNESSGKGSNGAGDAHQETDRSLTGSPRSANTSISHREISAA